MLSSEKISFVIPCYGSEKTISKVCTDIISTVSGKNPYEIICVNDNSPDNVYNILTTLAQNNKNIKIINLAKNSGQHNAILAGLKYSSGTVIVCLDDDGQTDPKECYKLIDALNDEIDVVYAKYPTKKESPFRLLGSWSAKKMGQILCDFPSNIVFNSYFACKRFVVDEVIKYTNPYTYLMGLVVRTTRNLANVEIEHHAREIGQSGYSFKKLVSLWMNGFTAFSVKPLRISSLLGFILASAGFVFAIYTFIKKLLTPNIPVGYSSIMCIMLLIGGMILSMLGLIGEYIGRIYICLNNAPQYVIKETLNIENDTKQ